MNVITLPERATKPRDRGLSIVIDNGAPTAFFTDVVESHGDLIDYVKFGWGTALVTRDLAAKVAALRAAGIGFFFGGTLFEKALYQGKLREYRAFCENLGCRHVEISNGTLDLDNAAKARYIAEWSKDFLVFSEVGYKDAQRSQDLYPSQWIEYIRQDRDAGAFKIITEARESGTSGICRADGELRYGLIAEILDSGLDPNDLVFEAPNKALQAYFVTRMGPDVNLGNVAVADVVPLETLRLGLRSDTFYAAAAVEARPVPLPRAAARTSARDQALRRAG